MAATSVMSYNRIMTKVQNTLPESIENNKINVLSELFDSKLSESVKCFVEAAFRDFVLRKICINGKADLQQIKTVVKMCIEGARQDFCLSTLPVLILSDTFDCTTIQQCEELFEFVESNVSVWKEDLFFSHCKNHVLRMCNDVLRRLSRSQNTIFCGRILLFLARFFPFSERSGLNLISEFNLENVTVFTDSEVIDVEMDEGKPDGETKPRPSLDYTLYTKFWALQDFFRNPVQCFQKSPWKLFTKYADDILEAFLSFKLDCVQSTKVADSSENQQLNRQISLEQDDQYFPKYLTNQKLLDLQFSDSNFRRYILVQMLILAQYLTSNIKFKQENLTADQLSWVKKMQDKAFVLLAETPYNGKQFVEIVKSILKREEIWSDWKNNGCPEIKKSGTSLKRKIEETQKNNKEEPSSGEFAQPKKREKRKLGDMIREADSKKKYVMGNAEMTRLWNICPNNMDACQQECRDFVPSLETYFSASIDQVLAKTAVKDDQKLVNDSNFGWRGLRLLASKSPHFFTNSGNTIATLPEYLSNMIKKVAKDLPSQVNEGVKEEEEDKEEEIGVLEQGEGVKEEEEEEEEDEAPAPSSRPEVKPLDDTERRLFAKAVAAEGAEAWRKLAIKLAFLPDEMEFFMEGNTLEHAIDIMFQRWVEDDTDYGNKENLIYILKGLKLHNVVKRVYPSV